MSSATADLTTNPLAATSDTETPPSRWPRALSALSVRDYRLYLSSQIVATTGVWMQRIAQDWLVLELTHSVTAVGVAVALQFLPVLLFGMAGGVVADRYPKRTILMLTQSVATLLALSLGTLALTHEVRVWHVYAIATLLGLVTVVDNPTRQVFVSELVGTEHIRNAVSLNSSVFQFGALLGPAVSGALIHAFGQGWSFLINAASCLLVVAMVAVIRPTGTPAGRAVSSRKGELREGLRYLRNTSEVAWTVVLVAIIGVFGLNMPVILSAFADTEFRLGVGGYSVFNSLTAVGALTGAVMSARRSGIPRLRSLVTTLTILGVGLSAAAFAPSLWLFGIILVGVGACTLWFLTGANSLVQTTAPAWVRGRVMSVYILVLLGGQAIGGPLCGRLIDAIGARPSMLIGGVLLATSALICGTAMGHKSHLRLRLGGRNLVHIAAR